MAARFILAALYRLTFEDYVADRANTMVSRLLPSAYLYWDQAKGRNEYSGMTRAIYGTCKAKGFWLQI